ncbi:hypothetical protein QTJ16_001305 [Diplocarpon rosae]|uniref:Uncharacterized protein n=1 Tax=Diplocarpon rosae TaxID=946125 RepID=A0AAD9T8B5_9HELO|nr:hypothetical protein QTJ16_001305 [Diplocarpon rosae]
MQLSFGSLIPVALLLAPHALAAPSLLSLEARNISSSLSILSADTYCRLNLHYCGWNLLTIADSDYKRRISSKLCQRGICDPNDPAIWNSLWNCGADLEFISICGGAYSCANGGAGRSDYCN